MVDGNLNTTNAPLAERGRDMMNEARDAVSRGAEEARGYTGATTGSTYTGGTPGTQGGGTDYGRS